MNLRRVSGLLLVVGGLGVPACNEDLNCHDTEVSLSPGGTVQIPYLCTDLKGAFGLVWPQSHEIYFTAIPSWLTPMTDASTGKITLVADPAATPTQVVVSASIDVYEETREGLGQKRGTADVKITVNLKPKSQLDVELVAKVSGSAVGADGVVAPGADVELTAKVNSGVGPYSYSWRGYDLVGPTDVAAVSGMTGQTVTTGAILPRPYVFEVTVVDQGNSNETVKAHKLISGRGASWLEIPTVIMNYPNPVEKVRIVSKPDRTGPANLHVILQKTDLPPEEEILATLQSPSALAALTWSVVHEVTAATESRPSGEIGLDVDLPTEGVGIYRVIAESDDGLACTVLSFGRYYRP